MRRGHARGGHAGRCRHPDHGGGVLPGHLRAGHCRRLLPRPGADGDDLAAGVDPLGHPPAADALGLHPAGAGRSAGGLLPPVRPRLRGDGGALPHGARARAGAEGALPRLPGRRRRGGRVARLRPAAHVHARTHAGRLHDGARVAGGLAARVDRKHGGGTGRIPGAPARGGLGLYAGGCHRADPGEPEGIQRCQHGAPARHAQAHAARVARPGGGARTPAAAPAGRGGRYLVLRRRGRGPARDHGQRRGLIHAGRGGREAGRRTGRRGGSPAAAAQGAGAREREHGAGAGQPDHRDFRRPREGIAFRPGARRSCSRAARPHPGHRRHDLQRDRAAHRHRRAPAA